jgi:hypothetical protein
VEGIATRILSPKPDRHEQTKECSAAAEGNHTTMTPTILRRILGEIHIGGCNTAQVAHAALYGDGDTTFYGSAHIVAIPCNDGGKSRVDATSKEESASVFDVIIFGAK